jgi:hypothetical protein
MQLMSRRPWPGHAPNRLRRRPALPAHPPGAAAEHQQHQDGTASMITKTAIAAPHDTPDSSRKLCQIQFQLPLTAERVHNLQRRRSTTSSPSAHTGRPPTLRPECPRLMPKSQGFTRTNLQVNAPKSAKVHGRDPSRVTCWRPARAGQRIQPGPSAAPSRPAILETRVIKRCVRLQQIMRKSHLRSVLSRQMTEASTPTVPAQGHLRVGVPQKNTYYAVDRGLVPGRRSTGVVVLVAVLRGWATIALGHCSSRIMLGAGIAVASP